MRSSRCAIACLATECLSWFFITNPADDSTTHDRGEKEQKNAHKYSYRFRYWYELHFFLSFLKRRKIFLCFLSFPSHFLFFLTLLSLSLLSTNTETKARFLVLLKNLSFLRCTTQDGYDREYSSLLIVVVFAECDKKRCETTQHCRLFQFSRTMNVS